jgi:hypothetical protein
MPDCKVNLAEKIGVKYRDFGVLLLEDKVGDLISAIASNQRGNPCDINRETFEHWLKGTGRQPVTWTTLVEVLGDIGLHKLADDIGIVKNCTDSATS